MANQARVSIPIMVLLLVVYAAALPALGFGVSAHKLKLDGSWRYSVVNDRLDYAHFSNYLTEVTLARTEWNNAGPVKVAVSAGGAATDLTVANSNNCKYDYIGQYTYWNDLIYLNICAMSWQGGYYEGAQKTFGPTPPSRRKRTAIHEFGHALGLRHNALGTCESVMRPVDQDVDTCYLPKKHDKDDMEDYWK